MLLIKKILLILITSFLWSNTGFSKEIDTINRNDRSFERSSIEIQNELLKDLPDIEKKYSGIDKFKKIAEFHNLWFQGNKGVYPDKYLWRVEKGDCSVLGKL